MRAEPGDLDPSSLLATPEPPPTVDDEKMAQAGRRPHRRKMLAIWATATVVLVVLAGVFLVGRASSKQASASEGGSANVRISGQWFLSEISQGSRVVVKAAEFTVFGFKPSIEFRTNHSYSLNSGCEWTTGCYDLQSTTLTFESAGNGAVACSSSKQDVEVIRVRLSIELQKILDQKVVKLEIDSQQKLRINLPDETYIFGRKK